MEDSVVTPTMSVAVIVVALPIPTITTVSAVLILNFEHDTIAKRGKVAIA